MNKKEKLKNKILKIEAKETKKRKKWHKYKDISCDKCIDGVYLRVTDYGITSGYDSIRCRCTFIKTKRYKKALGEINKSVKDYVKELSKFKDNYSFIKSEFHETDRTW